MTYGEMREILNQAWNDLYRLQEIDELEASTPIVGALLVIAECLLNRETREVL